MKANMLFYFLFRETIPPAYQMVLQQDQSEYRKRKKRERIRLENHPEFSAGCPDEE